MKKSSWLMTAIALGGFAGSGLAQEAKEMPAQPAAPAVTAAPMILADGGCGNGCNACCDDGCGRRGGIIADIGFMVLTPYWKNNPAVFQEGEAAGVDDSLVTQQDFDYGQQFVPRIALGAIGSRGFGGRISWWGFAVSNSLNAVTGTADETISPAPLGLNISDTDRGLAVSGKLRLDVWDFEALKRFDGDNGSLLFSAGLRYAHMSQDYTALDFDTGAATADEALISGHNFNGVGPTLALEGRHRIGSRGLYAMAGTRGSVLFGESKQSVTEFDTIDGVLTAEDAVVAQANNSVLSVGELEIGAGWMSDRGRARLFLQASLVGQLWFEAGNNTRSGTRIDPVGDFNDNQGGVALDNNLGLFGFALKAGLSY